MAADWLEWLARATLATSAAVVMVLALRPLWRRGLGSAGVLWLWLLLPAALVAASLPRPTVVVERAVELAATDSALPLAAASVAAAEFPAAWDWPSMMLALWLSGALLLATRLVRQQRAFRRRLGSLSRRADGSFTAGTSYAGPAVIGAWRPRIVVPADFEQRYDARQRELVLAHERCHLRRGDLQVNLLLSALRCVFWFNPLVHVASTKLRLDQELACDARVLADHPDAGRAYATALLNTQLADLGLPVGCLWQSSHPLKWRIAMLKQPLPGTARLLFGAALAMLASSAAAATLWQALPVNTVVLPVVAPSRAAPSLPPLERLAVAPVWPAMSVSLGAVPELAETAARAANSAPAPATATATATATDARAADDFQAPRVTRIWVADRPARTPFHQRDADISGATDMVVQLDVGADGKPANPRVVHSALDRRHQESALRAVKRWQFEPARRDGVAVASTILVPVAFEPAMGPGPLRPDPSVRQAIGYSQPPARQGPVTVTRGL
jgi:TonB family protein